MSLLDSGRQPDGRSNVELGRKARSNDLERRPVRGPNEEESGRVAWLSCLPRVEVGLYEVTETQLAKSLVDANEQVRQSFVTTGFHDYSTQQKGQAYKRLCDTYLLGTGRLTRTRIALYRPETKDGDPRLWVYRFVELLPDAYPGDLVAIVQDGSKCVVTDLTLIELTDDRRATLEEIFAPADPDWS